MNNFEFSEKNLPSPQLLMSWFYKSDLRFKGDVGWSSYSDSDSKILEEAFQVQMVCIISYSKIEW